MNKPDHLSREHGDQFSDKSIVEHYSFRPAYTNDVIEFLSSCLNIPVMSVLDVGSGTGEISIPLSEKGHYVVGVDPSFEMTQVANDKNSNVLFVHSYIEDFISDSGFDLIVAANSIHWVDWTLAFPKFKSLAYKHTKIAIITGGDLVIAGLESDILDIIKKYSTTDNFKPYNVISMLENQRFIKNTNAYSFPVATVTQPISEYIASFHARNGFSIERMGVEKALRFDRELEAILLSRNILGSVTGKVNFKLTLADIDIPFD